MVTERESQASSRFSCSLSERVSFEAGIKMATIYHQFVGTPFCKANVEDLERTIEKCIGTQPYVVSAKVGIRRDCGDKADQYSYTSLTGDMIDAVVKICIDGTTVTAEMRFDDELNYPLMFISSVETDRTVLSI
ncbi:MAG: dihydroneopterin aldolase family protein [archaeon]|nr:dihydroneopterin aldolase family protein [archaeon]